MPHLFPNLTKTNKFFLKQILTVDEAKVIVVVIVGMGETNDLFKVLKKVLVGERRLHINLYVDDVKFVIVGTVQNVLLLRY